MNIQSLYKIYQKHPQVFIDSRKVEPNSLFFALGQRNAVGIHRGNQFAEQAIKESQAAYAIINDPALKAKYANDERFVLVEDCEKSLQALAQYHRQQLDLPIIAIAGSNGKTTAKELLHAILVNKFKTFSTRGNLNNHLGVPLSLLQLDESHELAVLEIGANHLGETAFLSQLIAPQYGLVTNCGKDHLGEYGSVENVIKANKELYDFLADSGGLAFVNADDAILMQASQAVAQRKYYTPSQEAKIINRPMLGLELHIGQAKIRCQTNLFGGFWVDLLVAVAQIGAYFGVEPKHIQAALEGYQPAALRSQQLNWNDNKVLLDCYNANPSSMHVFLDELHQHPQANRLLILGEMLELGSYSQAEHQQLVDAIQYQDFEKVVLVGACFEPTELPNAPNLLHLPKSEVAKSWLLEQNYRNKRFFVKGSRANRLEALFS